MNPTSGSSDTNSGVSTRSGIASIHTRQLSPIVRGYPSRFQPLASAVSLVCLPSLIGKSEHLIAPIHTNREKIPILKRVFPTSSSSDTNSKRVSSYGVLPPIHANQAPVVNPNKKECFRLIAPIKQQLEGYTLRSNST